MSAEVERPRTGKNVSLNRMNRRRFVAGATVAAAGLMLTPRPSNATVFENGRQVLRTSAGDRIYLDPNFGGAPLRWLDPRGNNLIHEHQGSALNVVYDTGHDPTQTEGGWDNRIAYRTHAGGPLQNSHYQYYGQQEAGFGQNNRFQASLFFPSYWQSMDEIDDFIPVDPREPQPGVSHGWYMRWNDPRNTYGGLRSYPNHSYYYSSRAAIFSPRHGSVQSGMLFLGNLWTRHPNHSIGSSLTPHLSMGHFPNGRIAFRFRLSLKDAPNGVAGAFFRKTIGTGRSENIHTMFAAPGLHLTINNAGRLELRSMPGNRVVRAVNVPGNLVNRLRSDRFEEGIGGALVEVRTHTFDPRYMDILIEKQVVLRIRGENRVNMRGSGFCLYASCPPGQRILFSHRNIYDVDKRLQVLYWIDGRAMRMAVNLWSLTGSSDEFNNLAMPTFAINPLLGRPSMLASTPAYRGSSQYRYYENPRNQKFFIGNPRTNVGVTCLVDRMLVNNRDTNGTMTMIQTSNSDISANTAVMGLSPLPNYPSGPNPRVNLTGAGAVTTWWSGRLSGVHHR